MPSTIPSRRTIRFWNFIAKKYSRDKIADQPSYERKLRETHAILNKGMQVLEIGTGTGSTAITHAPHVAHIHAIDLSQKMIDIARAKTKAAAVENITYEQTSVEEFNPPEGSYDVILALSVLHLVEDYEATLARLHTMIKPGGYLVTSTVCIADGMPGFKWLSIPGHAIGLLPKLTYFTKDTLLMAFRTVGFTLESHWQPGPARALFAIARKS